MLLPKQELPISDGKGYVESISQVLFFCGEMVPADNPNMFCILHLDKQNLQVRIFRRMAAIGKSINKISVRH